MKFEFFKADWLAKHLQEKTNEVCVHVGASDFVTLYNHAFLRYYNNTQITNAAEFLWKLKISILSQLNVLSLYSHEYCT